MTSEEPPSPRRQRQWRSIFRINDGSPNSDRVMGERDNVTIIPYPGYGDVPTVQW